MIGWRRRAAPRPALAVGSALAALVTGVATVLAGVPAAADMIPGAELAGAVAVAGTLHVLDGKVLTVAQVGDTVVLGGTFTTARDDGSRVRLTRSRLLAFDATTGRIRPAFDPAPNGAVETVIPSGDGTTVYVGGAFTRIAGVTRQRIARISVADGGVVPAFDAGPVTGRVQDLRVADERLWVAGAFTHIGGRGQRALATLDPTTGAPQDFMSLPVAGVHNGGTTQVLKIDVTPDGSRLVAIGNFRTLAGATANQLFLLDLTGPAAQPADWGATFFAVPCASDAFDTYMRDVDLAPDGSYFVIGTTGGHGGPSSPCDTLTRWETGAIGPDQQPSWVAHSGGDTTTAVEVTDGVVYVGGHQRWWNNPSAADRPGPGAVSREGLAAVSPANGLPFSWNPTRTKGVGVFDFLATEQGLWIASDTDRIGNRQYRGRIARMPADGGRVRAVATPTLPGNLYTAGASGLSRQEYDGTAFGAASGAPDGGLPWGTVRGAFMLNGRLYVAHADGTFTRRSFDGTSYGPAVAVDTSDEIAALAQWRADIRSMTGMFYDHGRIYFTRTRSSALHYRYFNPESDVVGAQRQTASGRVGDFDPAAVRGMFLGGDQLYWSATDGSLRRAAWQRSPRAGAPSATTTTVSGPAVDERSWAAARAFFIEQSPQPPAAEVRTLPAGHALVRSG